MDWRPSTPEELADHKRLMHSAREFAESPMKHKPSEPPDKPASTPPIPTPSLDEPTKAPVKMDNSRPATPEELAKFNQDMRASQVETAARVLRVYPNATWNPPTPESTGNSPSAPQSPTHFTDSPADAPREME